MSIQRDYTHDLSYDFDGECEKQNMESPNQTAFRHFDEENAQRAKEHLPAIRWEDSHAKKELDNWCEGQQLW